MSWMRQHDHPSLVVCHEDAFDKTNQASLAEAQDKSLTETNGKPSHPEE
jgi:hypothetical protein